jgi:iron complex outermembrane receptor protein
MRRPIPPLVCILLLFIVCSAMVCTAQAQGLILKSPSVRTSDGQKRSGNEEKPLIDFLNDLQENNHISFAYQKKHLEGKYIAVIPEQDGDLEIFLKEILTPFHLSFKKVGDIPEETVYIIYPDKPQGVKTDHTAVVVSGKVSGPDGGFPVSGVSVQIKNGVAATITDPDGHYVIEVPDGHTQSLIFSSVGFVSQEIPVYGRSAINVVLVESSAQLSEVVITALGINRDHKTLGYSVSTLSGDELRASGGTNVAFGLYGKAPGIRIRTAPGGATSAVTVQIRGLNSLNYNTQPLYIIDGVIMRDANEKGSSGVNNSDYFIDERIRGNGILDINPTDVESLTVLKGASATALYGSDAASGAVVITTKKGLKKPGLGVELNYTYDVEQVAFTPRYQNIYGPGFNRERNISLGATGEGWVPLDTDNDGVADVNRPLFEAYSQFGPRMEGQNVLWWDGEMRRYRPQPDNYKDFYRTGHNSLFNAAISNQLGILSYRFSYTRQDYEGIQVGGKLQRNTFSLNNTFKINEKITADVVLNFTNSKVHNRPVKVNRLLSSWTGFFSRAEDMSLFFDKYKTSQGYKWVPYDQASFNPEEALQYTTPRGYEVMDFLWKQLRNSNDESQNRLISSVNLQYEILPNLRFRARVGNDFTTHAEETKEFNEYPIAFNGSSSTGSYGAADGRYSSLYTDGLLTYSRNISKDITLTVNGGFQMRDEEYRDHALETNGGLAKENWFSLGNSYNAARVITDSHYRILKYAYLGLLNMSFKDYWFVEATGRQEYSSTLPPENNRYFYPSINSSLVLSQAFRLPRAFHYARVRASYGVVGNAPPVYESNIQYDFTTLQTQQGSVVSGSTAGALYGNDKIKPENKYETEIGLEARFFQGRAGFDVTYYSSQIHNQILKLDLPTSTGAGKILTNLGELRSRGWELAVNTALPSGKLLWETTTSIAINTTKVHELVPGVDWLVFRDLEGGAIKVVAEKGEPVGNIYVYPRKADEAGNLIINDEGLYVIDKTRYVKAGNILPKVVGGMVNALSGHGFKLQFTLDYSLGGKIVSPAMKYSTGSGMYETTLKYRDAQHGGLPYYIDDNGRKTLLTNHHETSPNNSQVFHDGVLLKGVTEEGFENQTVIDAATYYLNTFDWGNNAWNEEGAIYDNSYIKMREAVVSYTFPQRVAAKFRLQNMKIALIGRNLFYLWRTLENLDPESTIGTNWLNQGLDESSNAASRSYGVSINLGF